MRNQLAQLAESGQLVRYSVAGAGHPAPVLGIQHNVNSQQLRNYVHTEIIEQSISMYGIPLPNLITSCQVDTRQLSTHSYQTSVTCSIG